MSAILFVNVVRSLATSNNRFHGRKRERQKREQKCAGNMGKAGNNTQSVIKSALATKIRFTMRQRCHFLQCIWTFLSHQIRKMCLKSLEMVGVAPSKSPPASLPSSLFFCSLAIFRSWLGSARFRFLFNMCAQRTKFLAYDFISITWCNSEKFTISLCGQMFKYYWNRFCLGFSYAHTYTYTHTTHLRPYR